jgi:hypothetical protein
MFFKLPKSFRSYIYDSIHKSVFITTIIAFLILSSPSLAQAPSSLEPSLLQERKAAPPVIIAATQNNTPPEGAQTLSFIYAGLKIDGAKANGQTRQPVWLRKRFC